MDILSRTPDFHLFDNLAIEEAERWAEYFYRFPQNPEKEATLKNRTFALYDPFARRDTFPAGIRFCANIYAGCSHHCAYCYTKNYIIKAEEPREKEGLLKGAERDIKDMITLNLPPAPLHISNSTDPFQEPLELQTRTTLAFMKLIAENRRHFTIVTFLTKNPILLVHEPYLSLLKTIEPCQVEVSLTFYDDEARSFYEPGAPAVDLRLRGIQKLRMTGISVSLRIDPLFPREPLPKPYWMHSELKAYGVERTHTLEEIEALVRFAAKEGCQKIIVSPLKVPLGYRSSCWLKKYFYALYSAPFGGKPRIRGFALRLPEDYVHGELFPSVSAICKHYGIPMVHCKVNLVTTK
jgi:DNA repair photolyase